MDKKNTSLTQGRADLTKSFVDVNVQAELHAIFEKNPLATIQDTRVAFTSSHPLLKIG